MIVLTHDVADTTLLHERLPFGRILGTTRGQILPQERAFGLGLEHPVRLYQCLLLLSPAVDDDFIQQLCLRFLLLVFVLEEHVG